MPRKKPTTTREDRAERYIDSPLMTHRVRLRQLLSVQIEGNYGHYHTQLNLGEQGVWFCNCPSPESPCKHVRALEATWDANPESFFDLEPFVRGLTRRTKRDLIDGITQIAMVFPESMIALGLEGFDPADDEEDEWY